MKTVTLSASLCLCCFLAGPSLVLAQQPSRKLVVNSSATVHAMPDAARLSFLVVTEKAPAARAREENDKQVQKMKEQLTALGFSNVDMQIVPFTLSMAPAGETPPNGFGQRHVPHAQTQFNVVVRDKNTAKLVEAITRLADVATENGARALATNEALAPRDLFLGADGAAPWGLSKSKVKLAPAPVFGPKIEWFKENTSAAQREAVLRAMADARAHAQAAVGDAKLSEVEVHVTHVSQREEYVPLSVRRNADPQASNSVVPVTMTVTVTFSY